MAINDRVGIARPLPRTGAEAFEAAGGFVCDGTGDSTSGLSWRGKVRFIHWHCISLCFHLQHNSTFLWQDVVIFGMGAFAIENVRTALEGGAANVVVVARRHGTICPKIIDYLNFVKPWECAGRFSALNSDRA